MKDKVKAIDLFAGCGGLTDGFEQSGYYKTIAAVEWEKAPCINLANRLRDKWGYETTDEIVMRFDIQRTNELFNGWNDKEYGISKGLDKLINAVNGIDMIIGGPPCQAYSVAGRVRDKDGMKNDYRNFLFESYLKVVKRYQPKLFVFENVPGILSAQPTDRPIIELIQEGFNEAGYCLLANLRDATIDFTEYGVPQNRKRVIILGLSKSYFGEECCPQLLDKFYKEILPRYKSSKRITVLEAIGDLPKLYPLAEEAKYNGKKLSHTLPVPFVENHIPRWHSKRDIEIFGLLAEDIYTGKNEYVTTQALKDLYTLKTGKTSNIHKYHVIRWNAPSNLIPAHLYKDGLRHIHPDPKQARTITVKEAARLQTFADDYIFYGSNMETYKMIGNAVPSEFARRLACALYELIK